jgi:hypothetical protein
MSISVQASVLAWRRVSNYVQNADPEVQLQLKAFKEWLCQHKGNPDLEFIPFDELSDTDVVLADAAATLYCAVFIKDTATATFSKLTDHDSASSDTAADVVVKGAAIGAQVLTWGSGLALATGLTAQGNTTADGGTGSGTNGAKGFVLIAAA